MKDDLITMSAKIDRNVWNKFRSLTCLTGKSGSTVVREMIIEFVKSKEERVKK